MVLVVGGGLAGAVAALWLQKRGQDVRILEMRPPGTTLCGEGVSARALAALKPVFDSTPHIDTTFRGARWRFPGTTVHVHQTCHTMARETWIPAMLDAFEAQGGTIERTRFRADADDGGTIVGCDGPGSQVRKLIPGATVKMSLGLQMRSPLDDSSAAVDEATDQEMEGAIAEGTRGRAKATPNENWLDFWTDKRFSREYAWCFPRSGFANVGILGEGAGKRRKTHTQFEGASRATARDLENHPWTDVRASASGAMQHVDAHLAATDGIRRENTTPPAMRDQERLLAFGKHIGVQPGPIEAYPIAHSGTHVADASGRIMLLGDAAGLTNPLTKGGIAAILHAAPILADAVARNPRSYAERMQRHPLRHASFARALRRLRSMENREMAKILGPAPDNLNVGGPNALTPASAARLGARIVARRLWLMRDARTFYNAARLSAQWSW